MPWSSLSEGQRIVVFLELKGGQLFATQMTEDTYAVDRFATATKVAAANTARMNERSFAQNQLLFTGRRLLFYTTLGLLAAGAAVVALGFSYANTMQQANVALRPMFTSTVALRKELNKLFSIAALTPFQFKDIVLGFTQMLKAGNLGATKINQVVQAVSDILSATPGRATANNLNRVTTALSHMVNLEKPTGQLRLQLARLGIPLDLILRKELGATSEQLNHLSSSGITAVQVMNALIKASQDMPRFAGQALKSQLGTFSGVMSTFKDFLSQASAGGVGGPFAGLFLLFRNVDIELGKINATGKTITLTKIFEVFDKQLSPSTHVIINLFTFLRELVKGLVQGFGIFILVVSKVFGVFNKLESPLTYVFNKLEKLLGAAGFLVAPFRIMTGNIHGSSNAMWLLGRATALLIILWTIGKIKALGLAIATEIETIATNINTIATSINTAAQWAWNIAKIVGRGIAYGLVIGIATLTTFKWAETIATRASTAAQWAWDAAVGVGIGLTFGLVAAILLLDAGLVVLYFKWKAFHDFVNRTYNWLKSHPYAALFIPLIGPIVYAVVVIQKLYGWLIKIYDVAKKLAGPFKWIAHLFSGGGANNTLSASPTRSRGRPGAFQLPGTYTYRPPGAATGGIVRTTGAVLVGERGPEIVQMPASATIIPIPQGAGSPFHNVPSVVNLRGTVKLNGKAIGEIVASNQLDVNARR